MPRVVLLFLRCKKIMPGPASMHCLHHKNESAYESVLNQAGIVRPDEEMLQCRELRALGSTLLNLFAVQLAEVLLYKFSRELHFLGYFLKKI
ncbi:hypothetical protein EGT71_01905 [Atlantibacter subterranea]|uniref:Uncharacterized protein n=1 Tax=Atlantibacter subterraneus TaxID=255519 RepID=A0A3R9GEK4_9ENTR|nr:hypothetical protein EGK67_04705 [Atlantibacter subterranea]RSE07723.1 hypothetical protein EGT84_04080 [Atlantibacter subterranea]RSE29291.1 hypothetical protein EGT71_01905 [Atlantibacter subterranea]